MDGTTTDSDTLDFSGVHKSLTFDFHRQVLTYTYTVPSSGLSVNDVATGLAAAITAGGVYAANASGRTLSISSDNAFLAVMTNPASGIGTVTPIATAGIAYASIRLDGSAVSGEVWQVQLITGFSVESESGANQASVAGFENVTGGSVDDQFVFHNGWGSITVTDGGSLDEDVLDFSAVTSDLTFTIHDDGTVSVTDGTNTVGSSAGIEGLIGGQGNNAFVFEEGAAFNGWIQGGSGAGKINTLDYSAYKSAVTVNLWKMDVVETGYVNGVFTTHVGVGHATGTTAINGIQKITGGGSAYDTLVGPMKDSTWNITALNSGDVNGISFSSFENLTGTAPYDDSFILAGGSVTGTLSGNGHDHATGRDTITLQSGSFTNVVYRAYSYVGTATVTLAGDATDQEQWKIVLTDDHTGTTTTYSTTVSGTTTTLADVASSLASRINALSPTRYRASAEGCTLIITSSTGADFETSLEIVPTTAVSSSAPTATVVFGGNKIEVGGAWQVTLAVTGSTTTTHTFTVSSTETTLSDIAAALAEDINAHAASGIMAAVEDETLVIVSAAGTSFTATATAPTGCEAVVATAATTKVIHLTGTAAENEQWTVTLTQSSQTSYYRFDVAKTGTTLSDVASGLVVLLNQSSPAKFVAGLDGDTLFLTNTSGATFSVSLVITVTGVIDAVIDPGSGRISLDGSTFTFLSMDSVTDESTAVNRTYRGTNLDDDLQVSQSAGILTLDSDDDGFMPVVFARPSGSLTLQGDAGDDTFHLGGLTLTASLAIDGGAGTDRVFFEISASTLAQDVKFGASDVKLNDATVFTTSNTESGKNLIVDATADDDEIVLAASTGRYTLTSPTFGTVTLDDPGEAGSLTINGGAGDDTIDSSSLATFAGSLTVVGGEGTDVVNLGTGHYGTLSFSTSNELVNGMPAVDNFVFDAQAATANKIHVFRPAAGQIAIMDNQHVIVTAFFFGDATAAGQWQISLTGMAGTVTYTVSGPFAEIGLMVAGLVHAINVDAAGLYTAGVVGETIFVTSDSGDYFAASVAAPAGATAAVRSNSVVIWDPTVSLTINTGFNAQGSNEYIHVGQKPDDTVSAIDTFDADLTLDGGSLHSTDGADSIVIYSDLALNGHNLSIQAETITINNSVTVSTSKAGGTAGSMTLNGHTITLGTNAKLLAQGSNVDTSGDISVSAIDDTSIWTPGLDIDISDVDFVLSTGAQIKGRDVTLLATADNRQIFATKGLGGTILNAIGNVLEGLLTFECTLSYEQVYATIDLQTGTQVDARNLIAYASTFGKIQASPLASIVGGFAVGVIKAKATVNVAGQVTTAKDMLVKATSDHWMDCLNDNTAIKGVAMGLGLGIILSDVNAHVTDDAVLSVGGNLFVTGQTVERTRVMSRSPSGKDGVVGIAVAISIEDGDTNAFLDGTATVAGDVEVSATMVQEMVPVYKTFVIPSIQVGTMSQAGTGSNSKGDMLDDTKAMITSPASNFIQGVLLPKLKAKFSKGPPDTSTPTDTSSFDLAGAITVVVDTNRTHARIGDNDEDGDHQNGEVDAAGDISIYTAVESQPWISAGSQATSNPDVEKPEYSASVFSGSLAVSVGIYHNVTSSLIGKYAKVDAGGALTLDAETLNNYVFSWFKNLVDPFTQDATYTTDNEEQNVRVYTGDTVEVRSNHTAGGDVGTWYEYKGLMPKDITLATEDFSDEAQWEAVSLATDRLWAFIQTLSSYLSGDFGLANWLSNSMTVATADGATLAIAGAITFLNLKQDAEAVILDHAQINQKSHTGTGKVVTVKAINHNETLNLGGNVGIPGLQLAADKPWGKIKGFSVFSVIGSPIKKTSWEKTTKWWDSFIQKPGLGTKTKLDEKGAVGVTIVACRFDDAAVAKIADGVLLHADSLYVDAETHVLSIDIGASGGESGNVGFNGAVILNIVQNDTTAQIASGATLEIGSALVFDPAVTDPEDNGSLVVRADDNTIIVSVVGGVSVSDSIGIGASIGTAVVLRKTQAVIGDLEGEPATMAKGYVNSGGSVLVRAKNSGFIGDFAAAGSVADGSSKAQTQPDKSQPKDQSFFKGLVSAVKGLLKKKDKGEDTGGIPSNVTGYSMPKAGVAISGSVAVDVVDDDALAYVLNSGVVTISGGGLSLDARNTTTVASLAGAVSYAKTSGMQTSVGIAGAFGVNVLMGDTQAYVDGATRLIAAGLDVAATRKGWTISLTAGFGIAVGDKAIGVGGAVGVNVTMYTVEALLQNTTGLITGPVTLSADDHTNLIAIAGAGGFGSKAGVGIGFGFAYSANTVRAQILNVVGLRHTGDLQVLATCNDLIVSVTGSIGIAQGSKYAEGGYAGAGTVSINYAHNTVEANILNSSTTADSSGDVTLSAEDKTSVYSFAGAFAYGKNLGLGAAIAVNVLDNLIRSAVEGSSLSTTSGGYSQTAKERGIVVSLAVAGAGSKKLAIAGSIGLNLFINTIDSRVVDSTLQTSGAIALKSEDLEVGVGLGGGIAISTEQAAVGAAVGIELVLNSVTCTVDGSTLVSTGSTVTASSEAQEVLVSVTIGGAGGDKFALGGAVAINVVSNTVEAEVLDSTITAAGDIGVSGHDTTTNVVVAGGFAGSKTAAVGVAASSIYEENLIRAIIDGSSLTSRAGKVSVTAGIAPPATAADLSTVGLGTSGIDLPDLNSSTMINLTVGGAGSSGQAAVGVSLSMNVIHNTLVAEILAGSVINAFSDVTVTAIDSSSILAVSVGAAGAGTAAVGGAAAANAITNHLTAVIDHSTVTSGGNVLVEAESSEIIRALAVGASARARWRWASPHSATPSPIQ